MRVADVSGLRTVRGVVLDQRSRAAVPYAAVVLPGQGRGTTADANGHFALALPGPTRLQVRSLGYEVAEVQSPLGNEELTVLLTPAAYALDEVRVAPAPPDPVAILQNVIKNIPLNYEQQDYATEVYRHVRVSNFDTLRYEAESVGRLRVPAGYRHFTRGFLMHEDGTDYQVQQQRVLTPRRGPESASEVGGGTQGLAASAADPVRISPLFVARNLRKFTIKLDSVRQQGGEVQYVLSFAAKQANHRSTGTYLTSVYQGRLLVQKRDYAVVHYEALWQLDTASYNSTARKNAGRNNLLEKLYAQVFSADRSTHVVDYAKGDNGRYYARRSVGVAQTAGRELRNRQPFYYQSLVEQFFRPLP
ncbi:MAG: carboxypeptidase-like regulatory domain-containing protein, partial [Hymenobacter sp.]